MFVAYDDDKKIVAFHDSKKVVKQYIRDVMRCNDLVLSLGKLKKKEEYKLDAISDLYLVRFGHAYVQSGYLLYVQIVSDQEYEDHEFARDILYRLLELKRIPEKDAKHIRKSICILEDLIYDEESYTPSLDQLERMKIDFEPYVYSRGLF